MEKQKYLPISSDIHKQVLKIHTFFGRASTKGISYFKYT